MPSVRSLVKTMNNAERYLYVDLYTCIKKHYEEVTQIINIEISLPGFVSLMVLFSPQPLRKVSNTVQEVKLVCAKVIKRAPRIRKV